MPIKVSCPRERAQMDITYLPSDSKTGEKYLLVVIDMFTKFVWTKALKNRDANSVETYLRATFGNEGFKIWQSDNGGEFRNEQVRSLIEEEFHSLQLHGAARKPSTQGGVERVNQTLKAKLRVKLSSNSNWVSYLDEVVLSYNTTFHSSIGMSPWYAEKGVEYISPNLNKHDHLSKLQELMELRNQESHLIENKEQIYSRITQNLEKNAQRMINQQQKGTKITKFEIEEKVLVQTTKSKTKKGEFLFPYEAIISKKTIHFRYKVIWKDQGPLKTDKPNTESNKWFTTRDLKKLHLINQESSPFHQFPVIEEETNLETEDTQVLNLFILIYDQSKEENETESSNLGLRLEEINDFENNSIYYEENDDFIIQSVQEIISLQSSSSQSSFSQSTPSQSTPSQSSPSQSTPSQSTPSQSIPLQSSPSQSTPSSSITPIFKSPSLFRQFQSISTSPSSLDKRSRRKTISPTLSPSPLQKKPKTIQLKQSFKKKIQTKTKKK